MASPFPSYIPYNPFESYDYQLPFGLVEGSVGSPTGPVSETRYRPSQAMYEANPDWHGMFSDPSNLVVESLNPDGSYNIKVKTGDKQGSRYSLLPDEQGGYTSDFLGYVDWDTNNSSFNKNLLAAMGVAIGAPWAAGLVSGEIAAQGGLSGLAGLSPTVGTLQTTGPMMGAEAVGATVGPTGAIVPGNAGIPGAVTAGVGGVTGADALEKAFNTGTGPTQTTPPPSSNSGIDLTKLTGLLPQNVLDWLKVALPVIGGIGLANEAKNANGQQNPVDAWTRDWARTQLGNRPPLPQSGVTEQYRNTMMSGLNQGTNPYISGLLNKRYY